MEYELKKLVSKIKIAKTGFEKHILSFLRACKAFLIYTNRRTGEKDKYAWEDFLVKRICYMWDYISTIKKSCYNSQFAGWHL